MVEYNAQLDNIFISLADPTRRGILGRLMQGEVLSIGEIAKHYNLTFAAISKHIKVLEKAKLVTKQKRGLHQMVTICPETLHDADKYLKQYEALWKKRFDRLEIVANSQE
jgi:DNA-binding transcriptional ArsR family regulator